MAEIGRPTARRAHRAWAQVLPLVLLTVMAYLALPGVVHASSQLGDILIAPASGPVGTQVHVEIAVEVSATTTYSLTATRSSPQDGGCLQSQPIPGVPPFAVPPPNPNGVGPYQMEFAWPAALDEGPYWLCAAPTRGGGPTAQSSDPFTVSVTAATATPDSSPIPSPTPPGLGRVRRLHRRLATQPACLADHRRPGGRAHCRSLVARARLRSARSLTRSIGRTSRKQRSTKA